MTEVFKRHVPYADFSPVDRYIAVEELKKDKRIMNVLYRCPERKGCPLVSPLAKPHEYKEVMQIIEREGITE